MISQDKLNALVIFRNLLEDKVMQKLLALYQSLSEDSVEKVSRYASFASELFIKSQNLTDYLLDCILCDENFYITGLAQGKKFSAGIEKCLESELEILEEISQTDAKNIASRLEYGGYLPVWETRNANFVEAYRERIKNLGTNGYGKYSKYHMFTVEEGGRIVPVKNPDSIGIQDLKGYDEERKEVIDNTLSLLKGGPAANVLLYGDAGTGKSSTVKAIANNYKDRGLRLIELKRGQLHLVPVIISNICDSCLKFIIYIDDLSFTKNEDDFGALKAVLEGSVVAKPGNTVIYATSNRRHLIRETFSDRNGDDIHINETIQELSSLSERFGLMVYFGKPGREQYLNIVYDLADEFKLEMDKEELSDQAERYALRRGGRSPRIARQLIEKLLSDGF